MRAAIFGDIHGNLPALEAVLADLRRHAPDVLICLGDVAMTGPFPAECLHLVASLNCPVVMGNADAELLSPWPAFQPRGLPDEREIYELDGWSHAAVGERERRLVRTYQPTVDLLPGVLAFHGSPQSNTEVLNAETPEARLNELRAEFASASRWIGSHTHRPLLRTLEGWQLLNPGSVGLPFELRNGVYVNVARAEYLLLDRLGEHWNAQFRQVAYPARAIQDGFRAARVPEAERWASDWVDA
ncbi:metallophosphoesterase family protein [Deinococcus alpinitundrae]|uniref:metallophosphoesterase family protein n=1 Tax=Deinococcus alpinitundrae TaxID=468913 RepID=UPI00137A13AD|nr:metallophosphoesterase family protein [Deinococcus alpinitundrae]